jgi:cell wall assembly regulator SMI1
LSETAIGPAFDELCSAIEQWQPELLDLFRPPQALTGDWLEAPGSEQLRGLWSVTGGQDRARESTLGVVGGLNLLGPVDSEAERASWTEITTLGEGLARVAADSWNTGQAVQPEQVRNVYFARGWIPVLTEPLEANYLAVDLVPMPQGRAGQIILCGRDEDDKCVVAPDLATLLVRLAADCRSGAWRVCNGKSRSGTFRYVETKNGRLLTDIRDRVSSGDWRPNAQ